MNKITIEDVAQQFESWRNTRSGSNKTPDHLLNLVSQLIPLYSKRQIIKTLKIGTRLFNSFQHSRLHQSCKTQAQPQNDQLHFIKLLDIDNSTLTQHHCQISKNGATLLISATSPETIIKHFLCYS